jgi:hypothetical protein
VSEKPETILVCARFEDARDSNLFLIKDKYFPDTQAILEGFSGNEVLEWKLAEVLTAPGHLSLVENRNDAGLIASLKVRQY